MEYTKSQRELMRIAKDPVKGFQLNVVEVSEDFSGVTTALKYIRRIPWKDDSKANINLTVEAARQWDVVMALVNLAGKKTYGYGYLDTIWRAMSQLAAHKRGVVLWLDDVRYMKPVDRECIVCMLEWVADQLDMSVRIVMFVGKVRVWDFQQQKRVPTFVHSARLNERAKKYEFSREGLDSIRKFIVDAEHVEEAHQHRAAV